MRAKAWILDLLHRTQRLECDVPAGVRALVAVKDAAARELGVTLGIPVGVRAPDAAPEFLFVRPSLHDGPGWTPLPDFASNDERGFTLYVDAMLGGWLPPTHDLEVFHFGDTPDLAAILAHLVVKGVKRGTTGWKAATLRDGYAIPRAGTVSIVTDGFGYALCAIRTERVEHLRFADINAAHAWIEGEGDRTLDDWREGHLHYFRQEARRLELEFTEDAELFFEHFQLIAVLGRDRDPIGAPAAPDPHRA